MKNDENFFSNDSCPYFPCHKIQKKEDFNCKFCYCPLYFIPNCGGNFTLLKNGLKDCSNCLIPHVNHDYITQKLEDIFRTPEKYL